MRRDSDQSSEFATPVVRQLSSVSLLYGDRRLLMTTICPDTGKKSFPESQYDLPTVLVSELDDFRAKTVEGALEFGVNVGLGSILGITRDVKFDEGAGVWIDRRRVVYEAYGASFTAEFAANLTQGNVKWIEMSPSNLPKLFDPGIIPILGINDFRHRSPEWGLSTEHIGPYSPKPRDYKNPQVRAYIEQVPFGINDLE